MANIIVTDFTRENLVELPPETIPHLLFGFDWWNPVRVSDIDVIRTYRNALTGLSGLPSDITVRISMALSDGVLYVVNCPMCLCAARFYSSEGKLIADFFRPMEDAFAVMMRVDLPFSDITQWPESDGRDVSLWEPDKWARFFAEKILGHLTRYPTDVSEAMIDALKKCVDTGPTVFPSEQ